MVCLSHNSCCDLVFCFNSADRIRNKNFRARIIYIFNFILTVFIIMLFRSVAETYLLPTFDSYVCSATAEFLTCFQINIVLRISGAIFLYHLILAVLISFQSNVIPA